MVKKKETNGQNEPPRKRKRVVESRPPAKQLTRQKGMNPLEKQQTYEKETKKEAASCCYTKPQK